MSWDGPEIKWTQLAEDRKPPTQYRLLKIAGQLFAVSKDHLYVLDGDDETGWVKINSVRKRKKEESGEH